MAKYKANGVKRISVSLRESDIEFLNKEVGNRISKGEKTSTSMVIREAIRLFKKERENPTLKFSEQKEAVAINS